MTPKQIAVRNVATFFFSAIATGVLIALALDFFGLSMVGTAVAVALLCYLVKVVYDMEVEKAEILAKLNNPRG